MERDQPQSADGGRRPTAVRSTTLPGGDRHPVHLLGRGAHPGTAGQIRHHLDECAPCFEAFGFEAELKAVIARKCRDEVPEPLRRRVADALRAEDVPS